MTIDHIAHMFRSTVEAHGGLTATRVKIDGVWVEQSYEELGRGVEVLAAALVRAGIGVGDRVAILGGNWPQWTRTDLACATAGAISVPIYGTSTVEQIQHILRDSGARTIVVENQKHAERAREAAAAENLLDHVVSFFDLGLEGVVSLEDFCNFEGADAERERCSVEVERRMAAASGDDVLSIIYTSGTTGAPKGAMLQHKAMIAQNDSITSGFCPTQQDHSLSFLPLSHAFERGWTYFVLSHGCATSYVTDPRTVADLLAEVRPTMIMSVPKLFDKVYSPAWEGVAHQPQKKRVLEWALRVGGQCQRAYRKGKQPSLYWRSQLPLADKLVLTSIRNAMGGNKSYMGCGGAPVRREVEEFFSAAGLLMIQGYGMTEAAPLIAYNRPAAFKMGTCGQVVPGGELRIAEGGEICFRGPNVMLGYWNDPKATAEVIDAEGWLHTGDGGYVDNDGYLVINDRLKDIIVTLNGKNIAPQPIEGMLLADPLLEQAVILGDNRPCLTLLVTPSMPDLTAWAQAHGVPFTNPAELLESSEVADEVRSRVKQITEKLPSHEQIRDIRILPEAFTLENGLLTPTFKVKRREVDRRFVDVIDEMYAKLAERRKAQSGSSEH